MDEELELVALNSLYAAPGSISALSHPRGRFPPRVLPSDFIKDQTLVLSCCSPKECATVAGQFGVGQTDTLAGGSQ